MDVLSKNDINYGKMLSELLVDLKGLPCSWKSLDDAKNSIHSIIHQTYNNFLICQSIENQKNEEFKSFIFTSLENIIIASLHEQIYQLILTQFQEEDNLLHEKCYKLAARKVTADQLGAIEDYAIPLPSAIVELASLDIHSTAKDKFNCLSTTFDLVMAELKGAIVDVIAHNADNDIPILNVSDITPILATVIIHTKPLHFYSNMYYIENFRSFNSDIPDCECILAFKTALDKLYVLTEEMLRPKNSRIYCDIGLKDILKLTNDIDSNFDCKGRRLSHPKNPLERHIEDFTNKIAAATLSNIPT